MRSSVLACRAALAAAPILAACGDSGHVTDCNVTNKKFSALRTDLLKPLCGFSSCHDAASRKGDLDLVTDPYAALVNVDPTNAAAKARGWKRVVPGDEASSFLVTKLTLAQSFDPQFQQLMPNGQRLDETEIDQIRCWIRRGATDD
jgi:hypothetical protein